MLNTLSIQSLYTIQTRRCPKYVEEFQEITFLWKVYDVREVNEVQSIYDPQWTNLKYTNVIVLLIYTK